jgi:hypothetical protein
MVTAALGFHLETPIDLGFSSDRVPSDGGVFFVLSRSTPWETEEVPDEGNRRRRGLF